MTDDQARQYIVEYMESTIGIVKRRKTMYTLVVIRHGESEWNQKNLFCGWTDVELTEKGYSEAREAGRLLAKEGFTFDKCYTSVLKRAIHTAYTVLDEMDLTWIAVISMSDHVLFGRSISFCFWSLSALCVGSGDW